MVWATSLKFRKRTKFDTFMGYPFMLFKLTVIMNQHTIQWLAGILPSIVKWPEREAAYIPTTSGEVKNECSCIFTTTVSWCALQQLYCTAEYLNNPTAFTVQLFGSWDLVTDGQTNKAPKQWVLLRCKESLIKEIASNSNSNIYGTHFRQLVYIGL